MSRPANHQLELPWGGLKRPGKARYSRQLVVVSDDWEPMPGVPRTRGECPTERPCRFVRCEWNLWMIDRRDRVGRHGKDTHPPSVVIAHVKQNCGADVAEEMASGKLEASALGDRIGMSDRQVRRIVHRAKEKLKGDARAEEVLRLMIGRMTREGK